MTGLFKNFVNLLNLAVPGVELEGDEVVFYLVDVDRIPAGHEPFLFLLGS